MDMKKTIGTGIVAFTLMAGVANAQTNYNNTTPTYQTTGTTTTSTTTGTHASSSANSTPNIPNTGAGGEAATNALALTAAGAIVAAAVYALRKRAL